MSVIVQARSILFAALFASVVSGEITHAQQNVLFIIVDDLRTELPVYGSSTVRAPNIETLASQGIVFQNAYSNVPVCGASRASLMTGLRPTAERFVDFDAQIDEDAPDVVPLHAYLKSQGYYTESIGKVIHVRKDSVDGWSRKPWLHNDAVPEERRTGHLDYQLKENIESYRSGNHGPAFEAVDVPDDAYFDGKIANRAIEALRQRKRKGGPFFLAVGFVKPHLPFTAPKKYWNLYSTSDIQLAGQPTMPPGIPDAAVHSWGELRKFSNIPAAPAPVQDELARELRHGYYASISYADSQVGRVLNALTELELDDDTIVILIGDHGWSLGEHGLWAKHSTFDVATRAPMIVRLPAQGATGTTQGLVEFVDIYPTLAELLDLDAPDHLQGRSFAAQVHDPKAPGKTAVFPRWKNGEAIKTDAYGMTVWYGESGKVRSSMLFDHRVDRIETKNLAEDPAYTETAIELRNRVEELKAAR